MSSYFLLVRNLFLLLLVIPIFSTTHAAQGDLSTVAGGLGFSERSFAVGAYLNNPNSVVTDSLGNSYISDTNHHRIRKVSPLGYITTYAGTGVAGFAGDDGLATLAQLNSPQGLAIDSVDNIYVADTNNNRIRKISPSGIITTIAGVGTAGFSGDGQPALSAQLNKPKGLALNSSGDLYIADRQNHRIRKIVDGVISTVAGSGISGYSGDNGPAPLAQLTEPSHVAVLDSGIIYIADTGNNRLRKVSIDGTVSNISTVAGTGALPARWEYGGVALPIVENSPASAMNIRPNSLAIGSNNDIYIADAMSNRIYKINESGDVSTYAGTMDLGSAGDGGDVSSAQLDRPHSISIDSLGNIYVIERDSGRVRKINTFNIISTLAGGQSNKSAGDGGLAIQARLNEPYAIDMDNSGSLYFSDIANANIRKIDSEKIITTSVDLQALNLFDADGFSINMTSPKGLAVNGAGEVVFSDHLSHQLYKRNSDGLVSIFAGTGTRGYSGDGSLATQAQFSRPRGIAVDQDNNYYIADEFNHRIRKIDATGIITTIAGTGSPGYSGDNDLATLAQLNHPAGVAIDDLGNIYIADADNNVIRKISSSTGIISTVAGNGNLGFSGDYGPATSAQLRSPNGVTADNSGNIYIADTLNFRIRQVDSAGIITTIAGNGMRQTSADDNVQPATLVGLGVIYDLAVRGNFLYIPNHDINRIRRVELNANLSTIKLSSSTIEENTDTSTAVTVGNFIDDGAGPYHYEITRPIDQNTFQISGNQLQFKAGVELNYEQKSSYSVEITRTDSLDNVVSQVIGINIININEAPIATISIDGDPTDGQTLQANANIQDPDQRSSAYTYQWKSDGINVGSNDYQYIVNRTDVGKLITVAISYTDNSGYYETLLSPATSPVQASTNNPLSGTLTITGLPTEDQTLQLDTSALVDIDGFGTFTQQWQTTDGTILSSDASSYTLQEKDVGQQISATISYIDPRGFYESITSAASATIANINDLPQGAINIIGPRTQGETLTAVTQSITDDDGMGQLYFQWHRQGVPISGANSPTYQTDMIDVNKSLSVSVSYTDGHGTLETLTSPPTNAIASNNQPAQGSLIILGETREGSTLSLDSSTITDANGLGEFQYQWFRSGIAFAHSASSYQTSQQDVGHSIYAQVSFSDGQGNAEQIGSAVTQPIANVNNVPTGALFLTGNHRVGQTLRVTAEIEDIDGVGPLSYQWLRNNNPIPNATSSSYLLSPEDEGQLIHVTISYVDPYDTTERLSSAKTSAIETNNVPPLISGMPDTLVGEQQHYRFTPTSSDADNDTLTFSINATLPAWLAFDSNTGELSGTPAVGDAGRINDIIISVNDGRYTANLDSFSINIYADLDGDGIPDTNDSDKDGDGMSNQFEIEHGLNPEDNSDKLTDLDGDGLNNLEEFLASSNPGLDDQAPIITAPADLTVNAEGLLTRVDLGLATASDAKDGSLTASSNAPDHFAPGQHLITWHAQDNAGNIATATQTLNVSPLVEFSEMQQTTEGSVVQVEVFFNGDIAQYPVTLPYTVSGTALVGEDHNLNSGSLVLEDSSAAAQIIVNITSDELVEGSENIIITFGTPTNAALGAGKQHVIEIVEQALAPLFSLSATQDSLQTRTVIQGDTPITVSAHALAANDGPYTYDWTNSDNSLISTASTNSSISIDLATIEPGHYKLSATANTDTYQLNKNLWIHVLTSAPTLLVSADSDDDGINDSEEGYGDDNNNGIPNYLDGSSAKHLIQQLSAQPHHYQLQSQAGTSLHLGDLAFRANKYQAKIDLNNLTADVSALIDHQLDYPAGIIDVEIHRNIIGSSAQLVIPQTNPLDAESVYQVLSASAQHVFIEDQFNQLASTLGEAGICPPPGSPAYTVGLQPNHHCVQLTVEDGGPNDRDGQNNGVISITSGASINADSVPPPGPIEPPVETPPANQGSRNSGGGGALYLLPIFLGLHFIRRRIDDKQRPLHEK